MTPLECALDYIGRGWSPVPIRDRMKGPTLKNWEKLRLTQEEAPRFFNGAAQNIGIILGEASGNLVDADLDCREAVVLAGSFLPPTDSVFGRAGKGSSHRLYVSALPKVVQFVDPDDGEMLLELRSNGGQTVFPGSTHESGELIEWVDDDDPAEVDPQQLVTSASRLAAACVLARAAPCSDRHNFLLAASGALVRGLGRDGAAEILHPVARVILGNKYRKSAGESLLNDTARKLADDEPVSGWPMLAERIGDKRCRKLQEWLGVNIDRRNEPAGDEEFDTSDDGLALEMGRKWGDARHVALFGRWLFFDGQRWEQDERLLHLTRTRDYLRAKADEIVRWAQKKVEAGEDGEKLIDACEAIAKQLRAATKVANIASLARSNPVQVASVGQWDADPWLLGTPGGTVDLRTGRLQQARLDNYITKLTAIAPAAPGTQAPIWSAFLERIFRHAPELVPYMQRVAGYAATGLTTEHALVFCWGEGGNGKGVFFNTLAHVLGDYARVAAPDLLLETQSDRHPTDMAMLMGARLVIASEVPRGRAWNEPKLKSLTGGDPVTARYMRQDFFTYMPQFTLLVAGNHKPGFRSVDEAIRRRVQLVPFLQNIPAEERDPDLGEKLKVEAPAILRWVLDGCLAWQREGLAPPKTVLDASESYLEGEDILGQWLAERCNLGAGNDKLISFASLFSDWQSWCEANGGPTWSGKTFSKALDERGLARGKSGSERGFRGITLRAKSAEQIMRDAGSNTRF